MRFRVIDVFMMFDDSLAIPYFKNEHLPFLLCPRGFSNEEHCAQVGSRARRRRRRGREEGYTDYQSERGHRRRVIKSVPLRAAPRPNTDSSKRCRAIDFRREDTKHVVSQSNELHCYRFQMSQVREIYSKRSYFFSLSPLLLLRDFSRRVTPT